MEETERELRRIYEKRYYSTEKGKKVKSEKNRRYRAKQKLLQSKQN